MLTDRRFDIRSLDWGLVIVVSARCRCLDTTVTVPSFRCPIAVFRVKRFRLSLFSLRRLYGLDLRIAMSMTTRGAVRLSSFGVMDLQFIDVINL